MDRSDFNIKTLRALRSAAKKTIAEEASHGAPDPDQYDWYERDPLARFRRHAYEAGVGNVGQNADWIPVAYYLGKGRPNHPPDAPYLLEDENTRGGMVLVFRIFDEDGDDVEVIKEFSSLKSLVNWLDKMIEK